MRRRYQGKRKFQQIWVIVMAVCVGIIVIGGGFLGIRALLGREGGATAQTEPNVRRTPDVEETLPTELTEAENYAPRPIWKACWATGPNTPAILSSTLPKDVDFDMALTANHHSLD